MHANEVFDSVAAPIHGAQRGLLVRAVSGQVATVHLEDDLPAVRAAVLALINRLSASDGMPAVAFAPALRGGWTGREAGLRFVAFRSQQPRFEEVFQRLMGPMPDRPDDRKMGVEQGVHQQRISTKGQARRRSLLGCSRQRELIPPERCSEASW